jgi:hypothetical protein
MATDGSAARMIRVNRRNPCPVCQRGDWCLVAQDGSAGICSRNEDGSVKRCGDAGWLHILSDRDARATDVAPILRPSGQAKDWTRYLELVTRDADDRINELAVRLGVSGQSLRRLGCGYDRARKWWVVPERDALGTVIGILGRNQDGVKRRLPKSKCGLSYTADWEAGAGPLLLVEGPSDLAAVLTMGLIGVGRPSNTGGVDHLVALLERIRREQDIVVIGERDQKDDGRWPGRAGAISTAKQLAEALERPISWSLPPDRAKDTREWLQKAPPTLPRERLADLFLSGLDCTRIDPPMIETASEPSGPAIPLGDWRDQMVAARIASLGQPGCYLDASPTGAGKSHVDVLTILHALGRGTV